MHELHIVKNLFSDLLKVAQKKGARKILKVFIKMGEFTEINEEILRYFFKEHGKDTLIEKAKLCIEKSPARELRLVSFTYE